MVDARVVSASPFRATLRMGSGQRRKEDNDSDSDFDREELPALQKNRMSPIKDDSEVLRSQRDEFLASFSHQRKSSAFGFSTRSERPGRASDDNLRGIIQNPSKVGVSTRDISPGLINNYQTPSKINQMMEMLA